MEKFFQLKKYGTTVGTEIAAGITTFFAMSYIIAVNPNILAESGMEWGAVFIATIIASVVGTLVMGLVANVPYAQAPAMGLNAFFVYTICFSLKFTYLRCIKHSYNCYKSAKIHHQINPCEFAKCDWRRHWYFHCLHRLFKCKPC